MFRNIQEIVESKKDRILIIVGNGHAAVLRHLVESSPEFEFIEFEAL
jgi:pheromone shutdown protein TraB